ncbi:MAG: hypothetical protein AAFV53_30945 [Myxococcota bacterium]
MNRATIDIGSNSILLLVVDEVGAILCDAVRVVGLSRGVGDRGLMNRQRMDHGLDVLTEYVQIAASFGVPARLIKAVATSGARRALNAAAFFDRVQKRTGLRVRIVTGDEEAWLTWAGARSDLRLPDGTVAVLDPGGGSTEIVLGEGERILLQQSVELGAVRLTEAFFDPQPARYRPPQLARLREHIQQVLATVDWPTYPRTLIGVAGTVTTLSAMQRGLTEWDRDVVHGSRLTRGFLRRQIDRLLTSTPEERREWCAIAPERADHLLAGACLIEELCTVSRKDSLIVSDGGVRFGLLHEI